MTLQAAREEEEEEEEEAVTSGFSDGTSEKRLSEASEHFPRRN